MKEKHVRNGMGPMVIGCSRARPRTLRADASASTDRVHVSRWRRGAMGMRSVSARNAGLAVLVMEGEAPDRVNGGGIAEDALFRAVLTRGLRLTTSVDHLDTRPITGWRLSVDPTGALTVGWPHRHPLFRSAPLDLPPGWLAGATDLGLVMVFVGHGLGRRAHTYDGDDALMSRLDRAARTGALAAGAVVVRR